MLRALTELTPHDWMVVAIGLFVVAVLQTFGTSEENANVSTPYADKLSHAKGFAAYAEGSDGRYGWAEGRNTLQAAEKDARVYCGSGCKIVETRTDVVTHPNLPVPVSSYTLGHFQKYLKLRTPKAFAITDGGSVGYSYGTSDAKQNAMRACKKYDAQRDDRLSSYPCRVIHFVP